jgi:hypothetical protein
MPAFSSAKLFLKFFLVQSPIKGDVLAQRVRTEALRIVLWKVGTETDLPCPVRDAQQNP